MTLGLHLLRWHLNSFGIAAGSSGGISSCQWCACHDHALNLVGAFVDLGDLGVAHHPFDREIARVARAAEQLHGVGRDFHRDI